MFLLNINDESVLGKARYCATIYNSFGTCQNTRNLTPCGSRCFRSFSYCLVHHEPNNHNPLRQRWAPTSTSERRDGFGNRSSASQLWHRSQSKAHVIVMGWGNREDQWGSAISWWCYTRHCWWPSCVWSLCWLWELESCHGRTRTEGTSLWFVDGSWYAQRRLCESTAPKSGCIAMQVYAPGTSLQHLQPSPISKNQDLCWHVPPRFRHKRNISHCLDILQPSTLISYFLVVCTGRSRRYPSGFPKMKKGKTGKVLKIANTITKHVWKVVDQLATSGIYVSIENPKTSLLLGRMWKQSWFPTTACLGCLNFSPNPFLPPVFSPGRKFVQSFWISLIVKWHPREGCIGFTPKRKIRNL